MSRKTVLVVLAHPGATSFGTALGNAYAEGARKAGHDVKVLHLHDLKFDPILRDGYRVRQELEPDLIAAQKAIRRARHIAFVYPIWWGGLPALLKGFLDRVFLPGFAFRYREGKSFPAQLLKGRSAHIIATMDTPPWYYRLFFRAPGLNQMKKATLEFCGIHPVKSIAIGPIIGSKLTQRENWLRKADFLGANL